MKKLADSQITAFDTESINDSRWKIIKNNIDRHFPDGKFTFADLGCGNGTFADKVLKEYPESAGTLLDNSDYLLSKNEPNSRKTIICDSIANASLYVKDINIVFMNWVLHHLVSDSYKESYSNINQVLTIAKSMLKNDGNSFISIFECMYNGIVFDSLPSYLIYYLRIISIAAYEHILNLPEVLEKTKTLLNPGGGSHIVAIPNEGHFLWKLGWMCTTGLAFRLRYKLDYSVIIRHEHVNDADEIESMLEQYYKIVKCQVFGISKRLCLYRVYTCHNK